MLEWLSLILISLSVGWTWWCLAPDKIMWQKWWKVTSKITRVTSISLVCLPRSLPPSLGVLALGEANCYVVSSLSPYGQAHVSRNWWLGPVAIEDQPTAIWMSLWEVILQVSLEISAAPGDTLTAALSGETLDPKPCLRTDPQKLRWKKV